MILYPTLCTTLCIIITAMTELLHIIVSPPSSPSSSEHSSQQQQQHHKHHHDDTNNDDKQWSGWRHGVKIPQARDSLLGQTLQAPLHATATGMQPDAQV
jgi:hypothetical protein